MKQAGIPIATSNRTDFSPKLIKKKKKKKKEKENSYSSKEN
jgi:hypothetical protein